MSTRDDLHRLVDQLADEALPDAARQFAELHQRNRADATAAAAEAAVTELRRRLPWIGALHSGQPDLAERSAQILRDELGTRPR